MAKRYSLLISDKNWRGLSFLLFGALFLLILCTFLHYGLTWDEEHSKINGEIALHWYASGFADPSQLTTFNYHLYGSFFNLLARFAAAVSPLGFYETSHFLIALFGLLTVFGVYRIGTRIAGPMGGFFSALFLALTPVFYGHSFNNPKDIPLTALFVLSLDCMLGLYESLPKPTRALLIRLGVLIGLTLGVRVGGLILFGYLAVLCLGWLGARRQLSLKKGIALVQPLLWVLAIGWGVMLVFWPYAELSPLLNPFRALSESTHFAWNLTVFFEGQYISAMQLPWRYLPTWFAIQLPEFYFISLAAGIFLGFRFLKQKNFSLKKRDQLIQIAFLCFAFVFPLSVAIIFKSTVYDGMRHFLFVLPVLTLLAGVSLAKTFKSGIPLQCKQVVAALVAGSLILTVVDMVQLHPYEYVYFNRLVAGGLAKASERFETDYWGDSYKEGLEWVAKNYHPVANGKIRIANCRNSSRFMTGYPIEQDPTLRERFVAVNPEDQPNVLLAITRWGCSKTPGRVLHVVERQNTPLLYVIETKAP